jgi:ferrous iron transport protein B
MALNRLVFPALGLPTTATARLNQLLGCPVVPIVASRGLGIKDLQQVINHTIENPSPPVQHDTVPSSDLKHAIRQLEAPLKRIAEQHRVETDWLALKLLEGDSDLEQWLASDVLSTVNNRRALLEEACGEEADILIADARYRFIQ